MEAKIFADSVVVVKDWKQDDVLILECPFCHTENPLDLKWENREDLLINQILKCPCGKKEWQVLL